MQPVKLLEDYQLFIFVVVGFFCSAPVAQFMLMSQTKMIQSHSSCLILLFALLSSPLLLPLSGVQLQLLPRLPGAHAVR